MYESLDTCPDDLLLFMHHVPYTHVLHAGKTVIQSHLRLALRGRRCGCRLRPRCGRRSRAGSTTSATRQVLDQLEYQAGQAIVWRDAVSMWFFKASGIADAKGRVGHSPGRNRSGSRRGSKGTSSKPSRRGKRRRADRPSSAVRASCTATFTYDGAAGWRDLVVQYFDTNTGVVAFSRPRRQQVVDEWTAADRVPTRKVDGSSSARRVITGLALRPGDTDLRSKGPGRGGDGRAGLHRDPRSRFERVGSDAQGWRDARRSSSSISASSADAEMPRDLASIDEERRRGFDANLDADRRVCLGLRDRLS